MSCTAKLPIYGFFTSVFFPKQSGIIMIGLYFLGIAMGILTAVISRKTMFHGEAVPICNGAAKLSSSGCKKCTPADVG